MKVFTMKRNILVLAIGISSLQAIDTPSLNPKDLGSKAYKTLKREGSILLKSMYTAAKGGTAIVLGYYAWINARAPYLIMKNESLYLQNLIQQGFYRVALEKLNNNFKGSLRRGIKNSAYAAVLVYGAVKLGQSVAKDIAHALEDTEIEKIAKKIKEKIQSKLA